MDKNFKKIKKIIKFKSKAFTLIEIMISIVIVSLVIIWWFKTLSAVNIWKIRIMEKVDLQKESFYFTQKLFEMIKQWWTLDYEEYFNRMVIWNSTYINWHYSQESGYWNYWKDWIIWIGNYWHHLYQCRSWYWEINKITDKWCYDNIYNNLWINLNWTQQRYWQYSLQFIDYNSNYDNDWWDEDWDWNIMWDDDDEYLWDGPEVFSVDQEMPELYLISWNWRERSLFRWSVKLDPNAPLWETCNIDSNTNEINWNWCIWNVEYMKLLWEDMWENHDRDLNSSLYLDWVIDTWIIDPEISWNDNTIAWKDDIEWLELFSDSINVSEFKVIPYPNKSNVLAWKNLDESINVSPYVMIKVKLKPSWKYRNAKWWKWEELDFSMTINLSWIYSN